MTSFVLDLTEIVARLNLQEAESFDQTNQCPTLEQSQSSVSAESPTISTNHQTNIKPLTKQQHTDLPGIAEFTSDFFDSSSASWRSNKILIGPSQYKYRCAQILKPSISNFCSGANVVCDSCSRAVKDSRTMYCKQHSTLLNKQQKAKRSAQDTKSIEKC